MLNCQMFGIKNWPQTTLHPKMNLQNFIFPSDKKGLMIEVFIIKSSLTQKN
jgi:hypothetical protein